METLLRRTLGEDVRLEVALPVETIWVRIDPVHLEQVLINLTLNARHALPRGGHLSISVSSSLRAGPEEWPEGERFTLIEVKDDGIGMEDAVRQRAFEPF